MRTTEQAPTLFRLGRRMARRGLRGGDRLVDLSRKLGLLRCIVSYELEGGVEIQVPLYRAHHENLWDAVDVREYERDVVDFLVREARGMKGPVTFVDCGADIGLISLRVAALLSEMGLLVAVEPNPEPFHFLSRNLSRLSVSARSVNAAVSDFTGLGKLETPDYDGSDHAKYIVESSDGAIEVLRIDDMNLPLGGGLLLKIDVEGGELAVLRGAARTLKAAPSFAIVFEAHPQVQERTKRDPLDCARQVAEFRRCRVGICETPDIHVKLSRPFFEQVEPGRNYNLFVTSVPPRRAR